MLVTPAFKGRVPTGLLIAANMMASSFTKFSDIHVVTVL